MEDDLDVEQLGRAYEALLPPATRRAGVHYTPRSLTAPIVQHTLEPLAYDGPAEGWPRERWRVRSPREILALRVCDPAMGAGAFLVQACRYLGERLVEAWDAAGDRELPANPAERLPLARRTVAEHCLFGVDLSPAAVDLARLSLAMLTGQPGRAPAHLERALRCGDSLLGLTELAAVEQLPGLRPDLIESSDLPLLADLLVGAQLSTATRGTRALGRRLAALAPEIAMALSATGDERQARMAALTAEAKAMLHAGRGPNQPERRPFHWPLAFPEVFSGENRPAGFDAFLGNPPFMVGFKLQRQLGADHRAWLVAHVGGSATGVRGGADLCVYFLLRAAALVHERGMLGFIGTNTIGQGDSREVGLGQLLRGPWQITRAISSQRWPGEANLEIAAVWATRGPWRGARVLDGAATESIGAHLGAAARVAGEPRPLRGNARRAFLGSKVEGMGFALSPDEAARLMDLEPQSRDVLRPFLNGEDLSSSPDQSPRRWVIHFREMPLSRESAPPRYEGPVASDYPECLRIVELRVKPYRRALPPDTPWNRKLSRWWWQFGQDRKSLYPAVQGLTRVLAAARVSRHHAFVLVPAGLVASEQVILVADEQYATFAICQSSLHELWARRYGSSMRNDPRYTPSTCFETFPFPRRSGRLARLGEQYHEGRRAWMLERREGLTRLYNRFHHPEERAAEIQALRELHVELDRAVAAAYGWSDLELDHGSRPTRQGPRFTLGDAAQREVLDRLLALNHRLSGGAGCGVLAPP